MRFVQVTFFIGLTTKFLTPPPELSFPEKKEEKALLPPLLIIGLLKKVLVRTIIINSQNHKLGFKDAKHLHFYISFSIAQMGGLLNAEFCVFTVYS